MSLRRPLVLLALLALVASLLALTPVGPAAAAVACTGTTLLQEDFEDASITYTASVPEFTDGAGDFFTRTDGSNVGSFYEIAGVQGTSYFAAMDTDGDGQPAVLTLNWTGLDITGRTGLEFCGLFAEDDDGTNQDWDADSSVRVEAQIDGGGFANVLAFESTGDTNTEPARDTDFDGIGDGAALTATLTQFAAGITGTGSVLDLRVTIENLEAGDEDIAFDNITVADGATPTVPELLLTELVVNPTDAEFIEIHNPGGSTVDLSNVYLTDATFAGGGTYYYNIVTGTNAGGGDFADFHARFPDGASIGAGEYQTVALAGSDGFFTELGVQPTYELFEDGGVADAVPDMREALVGSINDQGGLTNGGEVAVLYHWDGVSDLVTDLDYVLWGDTNEAVDKTGVAIDGPDAGTDTTTYLDDTAIASQAIVDTGHAAGSSFQRIDLDEGTEVTTGGNGALGHDETSEDLGQTWDIAAPTPGAAAATGGGGGVAAVVQIHEIQGATDTPPLPNDTRVEIEAIVVGDFQGGSAAGGEGNLGGFFVQEPDLEVDGSADTSEGIFVWQGSFGDPAVDVAVGDLVTVEADVNERFGDTQLDNATVTVQSSGNPLPTAAAVTLPLDSTDALEAVEGMRVQFVQQLFVTEYFNFDRFGEILLASGAPHRHPNQDNLPGSTGSDDTAAQNLLNEVMLDDGSGIQNPEPAPFVDDPAVSPYTDNIRRGQSVTDLTAFVRYATGSGSSGEERHRLMVHPDQVTFADSDRTRPDTPPAVGGDITVASFNVLNFFETIDDGVNDICGPAGNLECRGADSADELDRQLAKTVQALLDLDADVVGLIEIENDTDNTAVQLLVDELNAVLGAGTWAQVETGAIGTDAIRQAFIYRPAAVMPVGAFAVLDTPEFVAPLTPGDPKNRPALAQTFTTADGGTFTAAINHLKSKGSGCGAGDDDLVTFQGSCNATRTAAAQELVDWLATDPTGSGDPDVLILGDLNAYGMEDPIRAIEDDGYTNLAGTATYGYVFDGAEGTLDYALANASLASQVTGAAEWHINADEADLIDYNTDFGRDAGYFNGDIPFRASDHDPVIVGLALAPSPTIPEIQGAAHTSPFEGDDVVDVAGIVTEVVGNGFYVQDAVGDADDATSDAIFVFTGGAPTVAIGDDVLVDGTVIEFGFSGSLTTTQIGSASVDIVSSGNPLPATTVIGSAGRTPPATVIDDDGLTTYDPATDGIDFHESLESMLVEVADPVVVGPDRFGELTLLADGGAGVDQRTTVGGVHISPNDFNPERIVVDFDDIGPGAPTVAIGDTIESPSGVMGYTFGNYKVLSRDTPAVTDGGTTPETTTVTGSTNQLTVATYNVLNLDPSDGSQFDELATDIVDNLQAPDIVALQEIQDNNGSVDDGTVAADVTLQMLADAITTAGGPTYDFLTIAPEDKADGGQPGANIQVAYLYDASRVDITPNPGDATTGTSVDADGDLVLNPGRVDPTNPAWDVPEGTRRPVAAQFEFNGHDVVVINNHLKSKSQDDALYGSTQPPVEHTSAQRQAQAQVVNDFVDEILAVDPDANVIVLGDMNDFAFSAPLDALAGDALTNLVADVDPADRWSFVFDGNSQTLDHILVSDNLVDSAAPVLDIVHVNAAFDPSVRASDHDPVLVGLTLRRAASGGPGGTPTEPPTEEPTEPPTDDQSIREQCADDATCTSVTVSQQTFVDGTRSLFQQIVPAAVATEALLASDTVFADALASGALQDTRPLLLNDPEALEDEVLEEIQRLGVGAVWILGGVDAVGQDVEDALAAEGLDVRRIAGPTRLETAQAVAELVGTAQPLLARAFPGDGDATQAFADSLAAGGWAADGGRSVLLSQTEMLSDSTAAHLEASIASEATLVGGPAALAEAVLDAVRSLGFTSDRVAGDNRFATAARIATERGFGPDRMADTVIISEGQADDAWEGGFTAAAPAAVFDAPILLANGDDLPPETLAALADMVEADADVMCLAAAAACEAAIEAIG